MLFPSLDDNVSILINNLLYLLKVICFDSLFLKQFELSTIPDKFGHTAITLNMYVKRLMFFTVKEERESIESEYFWHIPYFYSFYGANIGIIFDTSKYFRNFLFLSYQDSKTAVSFTCPYWHKHHPQREG